MLLENIVQELPNQILEGQPVPLSINLIAEQSSKKTLQGFWFHKFAVWFLRTEILVCLLHGGWLKEIGPSHESDPIFRLGSGQCFSKR